MRGNDPPSPANSGRLRGTNMKNPRNLSSFRGFSMVREAGVELRATRVVQIYPVTANYCASRPHSGCSCYFLLNKTYPC